ncbi:phosphoribosylanthranilate isomerase [Maribacter hydrothermalis]|uniref:N-(5'-phosphoribosyl)anthranilate isomerase n=1 Tax=Maribacter hydrothermalis TaxID=1836467 RepID=A0A1B7ZBD3_9FLAO|nr:phosphoribosylanthranilate isomerase [Maribacter hydrothermalis]APQ16444.1 N-(5'-phosphoribosyl)anthranilate isomerase [Maribacter hydrothermalis]OBR40008.1 N-(5'-phosphoribosyl)anthranilate isomerase [Maribacter hydrothermalis]
MKLKICGMKLNTAEVAQLRPDYLGFIFWEPSSRFFEGEIPELPHTINKVGVFVDAELDYVIDLVSKHQLQGLQLHGHETPEYCIKIAAELKKLNQKVDIIKVFSIKEEFDFEELKPYENVCDYFLFDTKGKLPGGNGYTFNWPVLKNYPSTKPFFLSGGIGLNNLDKINEFAKTPESKYCYAIDVNSKFEVEPGLKNIEELQKFKEAL